MKLARTLLAFGLALGLALPMAAQGSNEKDLKDIGHRGVGDGMNFYSMEKEIALGKSLAQQVEATARIQKDPQVNEYINRLAQNLVRHSDAKVPFTVRVLESPDVNAAALPGGYFFVNTGLILAADNEAELAGVMAHEIAHVAARHGTRQATKGEIINYATLPLIFVGGGIGLAGRSLAEVAIPLGFLRFSRGDEREADYLGLQYMYESGYDPQAFTEMFEKLLSQEKKQPGTIAKAFQTHPATPDRIERTEKEIKNLLPQRQEYIEDTSEFEHIKARLAMLEHLDDTDLKLHGSGRPSLIRPDGSAVPEGKGDKPVLKRRPDGGGGGGGGN
ncbi:MAG TPA: M48 family metallopeptidase [Terriglobales bacterium]|nr:M48 family metallopeptidase [Terriglobales bacterium]